VINTRVVLRSSAAARSPARTTVGRRRDLDRGCAEPPPADDRKARGRGCGESLDGDRAAELAANGVLAIHDAVRVS
jgi:hypothetical protein